MLLLSTRQPQKLQHYSLLEIIQDSCKGHANATGAWKVEVSDDGAGSWIMVRNRTANAPQQGWKLHVSATVGSAEKVLSCALPVLLRENASFKVATSTNVLLSINSGEKGLSQVGKFLTVYPNDDAQAVRIAQALDIATRGLRGPDIPSDRSLYRGSLVHYRYGGSSWRYTLDTHGNTVLAISGHDGSLIPDRRPNNYSPPEWVIDPFVNSGIAEPHTEPDHMLGGNYLIISTFARSSRGTVKLVVDVANRRRCILKGAYRDGMMGMDGFDACDRLRQEAHVLGQLAADSRFPELYELFEQEGDLYLAMEDIEGEKLFDYVDQLAKQGRHLTGEQVVAWGREMASMLGYLHDSGLIYKDTKSSNVIITSTGLRLIDFDVAQEASDEGSFYSPGTPGYMSPAQHANERPTVADDIYGLGALLYFMATGAEPSMAPRPRNLLARPIELMNPAVRADLVNVITRCLARDPSSRFASMQDLDTALSQITSISTLPSSSTPFGSERTYSSIDDVRSHYRMLAKRVGDTLCSVARHKVEGKKLFWLSTHPSVCRVEDSAINTGSAGVVLALAELVNRMGDEQHRATLVEGAQGLLATERPLPQQPGLYRGEAGIGAALLRAGQVLGDQNLIDAAVEIAQRVAGFPYEWTDLFQGTAGRLRFHMLLWDHTGEDEQLRAALEAGEALLEAAKQTSSGGLCWPNRHGAGEAEEASRVGYGHGAAGICDALIDLYEATHQEQFLEAALLGGRWIAGLAVSSLDDQSGLDWPITKSKESAGPFWCHGATGIGRFFLHSWRLGIMPEAKELAEKAARSAARGARWAGSVQCHGLAGNIEFLLDMFQATEDHAYLSEALSLARLLEAFSGQRADGLLTWAAERPTIFTPDYMLGYAGVAVCLLRLSDPSRLPHQLSRAGFRPTADVNG